MKISDFSLRPLKDAANSLLIAIERPKDEFLRDSVIQRFEYTFELAWKTLKRYFEINNQLREDNVKNLIREAAKQNLIPDVEKWFEYLKARNLTSSSKVADLVYEKAVEFSKDIGPFIKKLEKLIG